MSTTIKKYVTGKGFVIFIMICLSVILILLDKASLFNGCSSESYTNSPIIKDGFYFDTYVSVTIYDSQSNYTGHVSNTDDIRELLAQCMDICSHYSTVFSRTDEDSELYILNNSTTFKNGYPVEISKELSDCIEKTLILSKDFGTEYSIIAGKLCDLWNFNNAVIPSDKDIQTELAAINSYDLFLNNNKIRLQHNANDTDIPNIPSIDLGATAKGYIAEKLREHLADNGIHDAIIDLGGNIIVMGDKYDDSMYKIGIKKPFSTENNSHALCKIADKALVTSGIYERYFETDNRIYHHIIDCSTGYPTDNDILSVTIISDDAFLADCYSTGCLLLGKDNALQFINNINEAECVVITKDYSIHLSDGLKYEDSYIVLK